MTLKDVETKPCAWPADDPIVEALEDPGYVIRCMILDCMQQFWHDNQYEATVIHLPPGVSALLEAHMRREGCRDPISEWPTVMGLQPVFEAKDFKLE